jgi:hypothetical protein
MERLIRLSTRPRGGQGQPYDDDVVAIARDLVQRTDLTYKAIAAKVGVTAMTIGRWSRAGFWRYPRRPRVDGSERSWAARDRALLRADPWHHLRAAERLLDSLERGDRTDLDTLARALDLLLTARRDAAQPRAKRRPAADCRDGANPPRSSS